MKKLLSCTALVACAVLSPLAAGAASMNYAFTIIEPTGFTNGSSGVAFDYSINNLGTAARQDARGSFSVPFTAFIKTVESDGTVSETPLNTDGRASNFHSPVINDAGQVMTVLSRGPVGDAFNFSEDLVRVESNGHITVLGQQASDSFATSPNQFSFLREFEASMNNRGDVAAIVETLDGARQIVKFSQDGQSFQILAEETDGLFLGSTGRVDINDSGQVAFLASRDINTNESVRGVFVADGTNVQLVLREETGPFTSVDINNDGDIAVSDLSIGNGVQGRGVLLHRAGTGDTEFEVVDVQQAGPFGNGSGTAFQSINLNNFGQTAYLEGNSLVIDGETIVSPGDTLPGQIIGQTEGLPASITFVGLRGNVNFNDLGQAIIDVLDADSQRTILRADPLGATFENPLVPFASTPEGQNDIALNIINGLGVLAPIFVDPIVATGFVYELGAGAENFASLLIPEALPLGDDSFVVEFIAGGTAFTETLLAGQTLDFTQFDMAGISRFSILGIDVAEEVDPTDPFTVGLTFVGGGFSSTLSIDAITVDTDGVSAVPLPASILFLLAGLAGLGVAGRRG